PGSSDKGPSVQETLIVEETDLFDDLDEILCEYSNTEEVGPMGNFKEVEVNMENEIEEESDESETEENDAASSVIKRIWIMIKRMMKGLMMMSIYLKMFLDLDDGIDPERIHNLKN
ncbi:hypothetical protein Tco_0062535, partial [Tanacetum coccineum]